MSSTSQTKTEIKVIEVKTSDGETFEMTLEEAFLSRTLKNMIADDCARVLIPLPNVTGRIFSKVITYCKKHAAAAAAAAARGKNSHGLEAWDAEFVKLDLPTLFDVILAANYLDIGTLLDVTCQAAADMIKDKTPEEVRKIFNIENDFTPEEEAEIRRENQWAFE